MAEFNCINCKYGMTTDDYEHCGNCDKGSNFVKMSNADRIRAMSDEELAEFLCHLDYSDDSIWNGEFWIDNGEELLKWLQSEAE